MESRAEAIVAEVSRHRRWREGDLREKTKGDPEKLAVAVRLRAESAVTVSWIAERLRDTSTISCIEIAEKNDIKYQEPTRL